VWAWDEYEKLRPYDEPTGSQRLEPFACHATPEAYCHGWAMVHSRRGSDRELLALRIAGSLHGHDVSLPDHSPVELFTSGGEAADHGQAEVERPSPEAAWTVARLLGKYDRLKTQTESGDDHDDRARDRATPPSG